MKRIDACGDCWYNVRINGGEINMLAENGRLRKEGQGRSTHYVLAWTSEVIAEPGRDGARPSHNCANVVRNGRVALRRDRILGYFAIASCDIIRGMTLRDDPKAYAIMGCAMRVHNTLGQS